jgi:hypothetical protein
MVLSFESFFYLSLKNEKRGTSSSLLADIKPTEVWISSKTREMMERASNSH